MTTHIERDGEILPAYDNVNQPRYHGVDPEMPHDFSGLSETEPATVDHIVDGVEFTANGIPKAIHERNLATRAKTDVDKYHEMLERRAFWRGEDEPLALPTA